MTSESAGTHDLNNAVAVETSAEVKALCEIHKHLLAARHDRSFIDAMNVGWEWAGQILAAATKLERLERAARPTGTVTEEMVERVRDQLFDGGPALIGDYVSSDVLTAALRAALTPPAGDAVGVSAALTDGEAFPCQDCGGGTGTWFAPNDLWNLVMGGPEAKDDPGGFLCPNCFIKRAEATGVVPTAWIVTREALSADKAEPVAWREQLLGRLMYPVDTLVNPRGWELREKPMLEEAVRFLIEEVPASPPSQGDGLPDAERQIIHELAADMRDRLSMEEGSALFRDAQRIVELSRPRGGPQPNNVADPAPRPSGKGE